MLGKTLQEFSRSFLPILGCYYNTPFRDVQYFTLLNNIKHVKNALYRNMLILKKMKYMKVFPVPLGDSRRFRTTRY
jgi:hypothetical protein